VAALRLRPDHGIEDLPAIPPDASPPADAAPVHVVRGTAVGLLEPVSLRLEHPGGFELLRVEEDGTFAFAAGLADGAIYSVTFVGEPPCVLADATGVVAGTIRLVSLACESVLLSGLALSGPAAPALDFTPAQRTYEAAVSLLQQTVQVTATTASPDAVLTVNGAPVTSGVPTEPLALALGDNPIEIAVANARGAQRIYHVTVSRAAPVAQYVYAKASVTEASDHFGHMVALWGDTLAVSTAYNAGLSGPIFPSDSVYIFRRIGSAWVQEAHMEGGGGFGRSIALWEDTLAIGFPYTKNLYTGIYNLGYVDIYRRSGDSWTKEATLMAANREANDVFGVGVALWGDRLAVGATGEASAATGTNGEQENNDAPNSGAVYVFRRSETAWELESYIKASNTEAEDQFGRALAFWGNRLVIGAPGEDSSTKGDQADNGAANSGAVYVFRRFDLTWVQEAYLKASNAEAGDSFGSSLALWDDTLAVGAAGEDGGATGTDGNQADNSMAGSGAVYIFQYSDGDWTQAAYIKASNTGAGDLFGESLALLDDMLAVGATGEDSAATGSNGHQHDSGAPNSGAVYLFHRAGSSWVQSAYVKASNTEGQDGTPIFDCLGDSFGQSVALWEGQLVASAPCESSSAAGLNGDQSDNSANDSGAVYIFH
jgi:hypothetical protein